MFESSRHTVEKEASPKSLHSRLIQRSRERRRAKVDVAIIERSGLFDRQWYLKQYPDVAAAGMDPLLHYVMRGALEGRKPAVWFDTRFYLKRYPKVAASGINAFRHFIEYGKAEGRLPASEAPEKAGKQSRAVLKASESEDADRISHSGFFDPVWYLEQNPDIAAAGMNPLRHFSRYGWKELRDPSPRFHMAWYWLTQQAQAGVSGNPLLNYLARTDSAPGAGLRRPAGTLEA